MKSFSQTIHILKNDKSRMSLLFYVICVLFFIIKIASDIFFDFHYNYSFAQFGLSDWLINYEGGFVRRGLIGEILYKIYDIHPYPMKAVIRYISLLSFIIFLILFTYIFIKERWCILSVLFPLAIVGADLVNYRRDFIIVILLYIIYYLFFSYYKNKKLHNWIFLQVFSVFVILIYESSFLLFVPILGFITIKNQKGSLPQIILKSLLFWAIPIFAMFCVCIWNGDEGQATVIWDSWASMFISYPNGDQYLSQIGAGVKFLDNNIIPTFKYHLSMLLFLDEWPSFAAISSNILFIITFPMVYLIVTRTPIINLEKGVIFPDSNKSASLGVILLIQFIAMFPMFTVLSCDLGRTIPLCIYTSFLIYHLTNRFKLSILEDCYLYSKSIVFQNKLCTSQLLNSIIGYTSIILFVPLAPYFGPHLYDTLLYKIIYFITNLVIPL